MGAVLCWESTTRDTSSLQRPEPPSRNAFSPLYSWEAGGINLFLNVLLVVVSQKQIRFTFFNAICILNHSESKWYWLPPG